MNAKTGGCRARQSSFNRCGTRGPPRTGQADIPQLIQSLNLNSKGRITMSQNRKAIFSVISVLSALVIGGFTFFATSQQSQAAKVMFTGNENHEISYADGKEMIERSLNIRVGNDLIAGYMGRNIFEKILAQEKCVGIRIYRARLGDGSSTFVIIGVNGEGKDLAAGIVGEDVVACPPWCDCPPVCNSTEVAVVEGKTLSQTDR
jgi:hypothetical protein